MDAGLCHGAAGVGHVFHRMYLSTREPRLASAARAWFARAVRMRTANRGFGGYLAHTIAAGGERGWVASRGFLEGAAGIAVALAGAVDRSQNLGWDRVLLVSG